MLRSNQALLLVDVQKDFLPGGRLAVPKGDSVLPVLGAWVKAFDQAALAIFASRDWHPANHVSFEDQGGPWPPHCVAGTSGANLSEDLKLPRHALLIDKGTDPKHDAYSAFQGTDLDTLLKARDITALVVGGLATEYCVLNTVKDALALGYQVLVLEDGIKALAAEPGALAIEEMRGLGATVARRPVPDPGPDLVARE